MQRTKFIVEIVALFLYALVWTGLLIGCTVLLLNGGIS